MEEELHLKMKDDTDRLSTCQYLNCANALQWLFLLQVHLIMTVDWSGLGLNWACLS